MWDDGIAVIGLACRLPQAPDPPSFWRLLRAGVDAVTAVPAGRWGRPADAYQGGFLDRIDLFDPAFFDISPREAAAMDPQQRLVLELAWEALEDAGIVPATLRGSRTAVVVGAMWDDYATMTLAHGSTAIDHHTMTGVHRSLIASRVSYALGLRGPSLAVDTGQSSSLVTVHLASESLRRGEAALALAGGVNLAVVPASTITTARFGGLSPDGRCRTFDADANGFVRGEGGGVVVLKLLRDAIADGDRVYCVIRGSAVNSGGAPQGVTVPDIDAQREVLELAYARAGVDPADVQYVELHGTGTRVGDPVEAAALGAALGTVRGQDSPLLVGSAKTNVGHVEAAAGVVGLLKAALSIRHREIPASLHFRAAPADIPLDELNLQVNTALRAWPRPGDPLLAGVSAFGMGGTNCHVVVSDWPGPEPASGASDAADRDSLGVLPWLVSARDATALRAQADRLRAHVVTNPALDLADVGYSLATTRSSFEHRAVVVAAERGDFLAGLHALACGEGTVHTVSARVPAPGRLAVLFAGQGSQRLGMGRELHRTFGAFAAAFDEACDHLDQHGEQPLRDVVFAAPGPAATALLDQTAYAQPALFALEVALFRLLEHWGVRPHLLVGHSIGEIAAAHVAGVLPLADAARMVAARGQLMQALPGGAMFAVQVPEEVIRTVLRGREAYVDLAAVNGPASVVIAGDEGDVVAVGAELVSQGYRSRRLRVSHAFHSPHMEAMLDDFRAVVAGCSLGPPRIPIVSTVTGEMASPDEVCDPEYWVRHARRSVRFADAIATAGRHGVTGYLELGPDATVTGLVGHCLAEPPAPLAPTLRAGQPEAVSVLTAVARVHVNGFPVDWRAVYSGRRTRRVTLPTYAFQRQRCWLDRPGAPAGDVPEQLPPAQRRAATAESPRLDGVRRGQAGQALVELVRSAVAVVLGYPSPQSVDTERTFTELGVTSLAAVELADRLASAGLRLAPAEIFNHPTVTRLASHLDRTGHRDDMAIGERPAQAPVSDEPIAIIAMSCRFPGGVRSAEDLWELVASGRDALSRFPTNRGWDLEGLFDPDPDKAGTSSVSTGGFLPDADQFDAAFFGISPPEATAMDPQQRLLLEISWEAFERADIDPQTLRGSATGVFVGATGQEYGPRLHEAAPGYDRYLLTGNTMSVASGRLAYTFGLTGPAVTVDTACSASLVAVHLAAQALSRGECDLAVAGGACVMATPGMFVAFSRQRGLAPDGRCKAFAAAADGTGWSEGAGILLLQRLSDARRVGRRVLAVQRGSAINQDGASNGLTAPSGVAQEQVIRRALASAGLTPADIDAVEAHGTGTTLGDPIEAQALITTYGQQRPDGRPLWIGSLKSNIGHTQAVAGVGGVIKMVMAIRHATLPATLHIDTPSPQVDWSAGAVRPLVEAIRWPDPGRPRRGGVSSFGISGTNAHVILEEADPGDGADADARAIDAADALPVPWVISGRTEDALRAQARALAAHVEARPQLCPADVGRSLVTTRSAFEHRAVVVATDRAEFLGALQACASGRPAAGLVSGHRDASGQIAVLFTGQGSQRPGAGRELYRTYPAFAAALDLACEHLDAHLDQPLREVMLAAPGSPRAALLRQTCYAQPALFALEVALYRLAESFGLVPDHLLGHSVGELAAAHVAGVLSVADAAAFVTARGRLMQATARGAMVALEATEEQARDLLAGHENRVAIAAVNGPAATVISGEPEATAALAARWGERGRRATALRVEQAFHSPLMDETLDELHAVVRGLRLNPPTIPIVASLDGQPAGARLSTPEYWVRQARETVRFAAGVETLRAQGATAYLELGPDAVLAALAEDCLAGSGPGPRSGTVAAVLGRDQPEATTFLTGLAELYAGGAALVWPETVFGPTARRVELPTYAFQRRRYWLPPVPPPPAVPAAPATPVAGRDQAGTGQGDTHHPLVGCRIELPGATHTSTSESRFASTLATDRPCWIAQHRILGVPVLPGAAMVEWALAAARSAASSGPGAWTLRGVTFNEFLPFADPRPVAVQAVVAAHRDGFRVRCFARNGPAWVEHVTAAAAPHAAEQPAATPPGQLCAGMAEQSVPALYARVERLGVEYGPPFRGLRGLWRRGDEAVALIEGGGLDGPSGDAFGSDASGYLLHPPLLDACIQTVAALANPDDPTDPASELAWLPVGLDQINVYQALPGRLWCRTSRREITDAGELVLDLALLDESGQRLATGQGLRYRRVARDTLAGLGGRRLRRQEVAWVRAGEAPPTLDVPAGAWLVLGEDPTTVARWRAGLAALNVPTLGSVASPDVAGMLGELRARRAAVGGVVLCPGASAPDPDEDVPDRAYTLARHAFEPLAQVLREHAGAQPWIIIGSTGASAPRPELDILDPAQAVLTGMARAVIAEYPDLRCVQVDVDPAAPAPGPHEVLARVAGLAGSGHLAVRDGQWFEARLRERDLPDEPGMPVDPDGTYLITGGLGGLGLAAAVWLAGRGARSLLLTGRGTGAGQPAAVAALRARGVRVELRAADVADPLAVADLVEYAQRELPPLRGVIHAAGVTDDASLTTLDWPRFGRVLDPKVRGAWHLHHRLADTQLDFFVLYSSITALIGSAGQSSYVVANSFLDALAGQRRRTGRPALSVSWGPWAEVGMAARRGLLSRFAELGMAAIQADEGLDALARLVADGVPAHVGVAGVDWATYRGAAARGEPYTLLAGLAPLAPSPAWPAQPGSTQAGSTQPGHPADLEQLVLREPAAAGDILLTELLERVASLLRIPAEGRDRLRPTFGDTRLGELGLDSLTTVRLRNRLMADFGVDLPPDVLFGRATAREVVDLACQQMTLRRVVATEADGPADEASMEIVTL